MVFEGEVDSQHLHYWLAKYSYNTVIYLNIQVSICRTERWCTEVQLCIYACACVCVCICMYVCMCGNGRGQPTYLSFLLSFCQVCLSVCLFGLFYFIFYSSCCFCQLVPAQSITTAIIPVRSALDYAASKLYVYRL